jgi:hypothetical protein
MDKANFIEVYNDVFDDEYCRNAINFMDYSEEHGFCSDRQADGADPTEIQDNAVFIPNARLENGPYDLASICNKNLWGVAYAQYAKKYGILKRLGPHNSFTMKLQKTRPGEGYHVWHAESMVRTDCHRVLTWSIYLNDNFDAGETEFLYQQYRYKPKQGDVVIFPAAFTHTHRGNPPINGTKYIITGWIEF